MKKLMIAAAIVCAAAFAQAATYNWTVKSGAGTFNGYDAPTVGTVWAGATMTAGMSWYLIHADTMSQDAALAAVRAGTSLASATLASGTTVAANPGVAQVSFTQDSDKFALDKNGNLNSYFVIINADGDSAYFSSVNSTAADTQGGTSDISIMTTTSKKLIDKDGTITTVSGGGWYAAAPEPTSGLLLLLGMAGLALKRKRA